MKRSWMTLAAALFALAVAAVPAEAQGGRRGGGAQGGMQDGAARMMDLLFKDITLDSVQTVKIGEIRAKYQQEMPAMQRGERPSRDEMAKRRDLMQQQQQEMRAVLTPEQQKTFDRNIEEMRTRMRDGARDAMRDRRAGRGR